MPVRYTRVGWQDAPSTDTPIDAANLNHMDNGILALSQEVDTELDSLREDFTSFEEETSSRVITLQNSLPAMIGEQIDTKFGDSIGDEITSWLNSHVDPAGSAVVVDDSLSVEGAAADAEKTGTLIRKNAWTGVCSTGITTQDKVINLDDATGYINGVYGTNILVNFLAPNKNASPRLKVGSGIAYPVAYPISESPYYQIMDAEHSAWGLGVKRFMFMEDCWLLMNPDFVHTESELDEVKDGLNYGKTATAGYILTATNSGHGSTWSPVGLPTDEQTAEAVTEWLNAHPEATTTVQDGAISASKLNSALLKDYQKSGTAMVFFPSLANGGYSGSTALMVAEGKTILFDAAPETNKTAVMAYYQSLYNAGVFSNIDIIVISHFHWDHYECLGYILEAFPHSNCKAYIPQSPSGYYTESDASSILASRTEVIETLEQYGVTINEVSTDTTVSVTDNFVSIELFNSTTSDYTYYSSNTTDYNNYSMVSLVKVGDIYAMFPADIKRVAQDRIISQRTLPRLFLYTVHHHGMEDGDNVQYLDMISPEWSIIQTSHNRQLISGAVGMAANYSTTHLCSTAYGSYAFVMQKNGGYIVDGADIERSGWYYNYFDLHVDNEYTGTVFDGSQEHPFTSINEVNLFIKDDRNLHYRVYVKATSTEYDLLWMRDYGCTVEFYGVANGNILKPTINGVYIRACTNIYFTGMILKTGRTTNNIKSVCYVSESTVYFNGCEIDGNDRSGVNGIQTHLAQAYVSDSTIKNCSDAFVPYRFGNVITNGISFDNVNCCYRQSNQEITIRGTDTINNINSYISSYSANGAIPVKISSVTLSDFKTLCTKNSNVAISEVFRSGNNLYKVEGANVMSPATWTAGDLFAKRITDDLNNAVEFGFYSYTTNASNRPTGLANDSGGLLVFGYSAKYLTQIATVNDGNALNIAVRKCVNGSFGSWHILTAT